MSQNQCNICGANYEYVAGRWKCPACGAFKAEELSNEEVTLLYNAAQKLRVQEFDVAEELYSDIINNYPQQHEAYWGYVCSKYGIKYEVDFDGRKIPTSCYTTIESFIDDADYKKAVKYAPSEIATWYKSQADYIERVRTTWIEKAKKEAPYDIFISYKDSDVENGIERTEDSYNALELYNHLAMQGYNVFYSRESLRGKIGEKYEPYIYHALQTAKVMIVYGSSVEYVNSTWVKNEWHRYIKQISRGEKAEGSLLVVCDGFSPNELPTILSSKQCLDGKSKKLYIDIDDYLKRLYSKKATEEKISAPKKKIVVNPLHEHTYTNEVVPASCVARGYTVHRCACGYEHRDNYTNLAAHKYTHKTTKEPTCTEPGYIEEVCAICGDKKKNSIPLKGHTYGKWIEKIPPTCTVAGKKIRQCSDCGHIEEETLAAKGHQWSPMEQRIDGQGNKEYVSFCKLCGKEKVSKKTEEDRKAKQVYKQARKKKLLKCLGAVVMTLIFLAYSIGDFLDGGQIGGGIFALFFSIVCVAGIILSAQEYRQLNPKNAFLKAEERRQEKLVKAFRKKGKKLERTKRRNLRKANREARQQSRKKRRALKKDILEQARQYDSQRKYDLAIKYYLKAVKRGLADQYILLRISTIYEIQGKYRKAYTYLQQVDLSKFYTADHLKEELNVLRRKAAGSDLMLAFKSLPFIVIGVFIVGLIVLYFLDSLGLL